MQLVYIDMCGKEIILSGTQLPVHDAVLALVREADDNVKSLSLENSDLVHHQKDGGSGYKNPQAPTIQEFPGQSQTL